jgi:hypothetical protein
VPGDFEPHMTGIAEWFRARSAADSRTANAPTRATRPRAPTRSDRALRPRSRRARATR